MSTLRTNAILDASGGNTATINTVPLRPGVLDPENRIINGAFDFWQRGTSSTSGGYVAADRWRNDSFGGTVTQSRQAFTLGDTLGTSSPTYFLRQTVSGQSLAAHNGVTVQRIEGVRTYASQTITVLGWARRSSGSGNMAVEVYQDFGTGGSPSSAAFGTGQTVTLTSSWAPFALTFNVPSISGKTLGTNNNDFLGLILWSSAGSDYNARTNSLGLQTIGVDLWGVHIKVGTHTTAATDLYKQPELGPELQRCQRYCVVMGGTSVYERFGVCELEASSSGSAAIPLPVKMRGGLSVSSTAASGFAVYSAGTVFTASAISSNNNSFDVANVVATISGGTAGRAGALISNNNTTARLTFDAEL